MKCPSCGAERPRGSSFCGSCGADIAGDGDACCHHCGAALPAGAIFCARCGTRHGESSGAEQDLVAVVTARHARKRSATVSSPGGGSGVLKRVGMILLGLVILAFGLSQGLLLVVGDTRSGVVTEVGARQRQSSGFTVGDKKRYEYVYPVKYAFTASNGQSFSGKFDFPQGEKLPPRTGSTVQVRYLSFYPPMNAVSDDLSFSMTSLLLMVVGGGILLVSLRG